MSKINCLPSLIEFNLSRRGYRITTARKTLINFIISFEGDFFSISDFIEMNPSVNVATFYNNIQLFEDSDILGKLKNDNESKYFIKSKTNIIITCENCTNQQLKKLDNLPLFEIEDIIRYDAQIFVKKCQKCV